MTDYCSILYRIFSPARNEWLLLIDTNMEKYFKIMNFPGSSLHLLQPKQEQRWAVKVSGNWRVTFIFLEGDAYEVNYTDYH